MPPPTVLDLERNLSFILHVKGPAPLKRICLNKTPLFIIPMDKRNRIFSLLDQIGKCETPAERMPHLVCLKKEFREQSEISQNEAEDALRELIALVLKETKTENIVEILGSLFNIFVAKEKLRDICLQTQFIDFLVENLRKPSLLSQLQFATLRIFFVVSSSEKGAHCIFIDPETIKKIILLSHALIEKSTEKAYEHLQCCLHILYSFTYRCKANARIIDAIVGLIYSVSEAEDFPPRMLTGTYALMLGLDMQMLRTEIKKRPPGEKSLLELTEDILAHTETVFAQNRSVDTQEEKIDFDIEVEMSTLVCVLTHICKQNEEIRKAISHRVLPYPRDISSLPTEGCDLRRLFGEQLLTKNLELKSSIGEFVFILCKRKASRLVYHFGLGRSAATLLENNVLDIHIKGSFVSSDEEYVDEYPEDYDIVAGKTKKESDEEFTPEERAAQEEEVLELFEKYAQKH
eukprot:GHVN01007423.1.p1 GENE.GHVN01007423.1~~GHVN01007423.1.p1  ORF type:complete len:461 (-),score=40.53 GHVN01007423.1:1049-2431(-)